MGKETDPKVWGGVLGPVSGCEVPRYVELSRWHGKNQVQMQWYYPPSALCTYMLKRRLWPVSGTLHAARVSSPWPVPPQRGPRPPLEMYFCTRDWNSAATGDSCSRSCLCCLPPRW